jgi:hypothetical protein
MLRRWFHRVVLARLWATYVCLGVSFFAFGAGTLNIVYLLKANTDLLLSYGWQAVMDGGLQQLLELVVTGYLSLAAYVVFKACEYRLVNWLKEAPPAHAASVKRNKETEDEDRHPPR